MPHHLLFDKRPTQLRLLLLPALATLLSCQSASPPDDSSGADSPSIAASSSYLASAVRDVMGDSEPVLVLAEPGMCPGHFDLRPSQVQQMRRCRTLLRFEFQQSLDRRLGDDAAAGPAVVAVSVPGGMCEPESYLAVCRQIGDALVHQGRLSRERADVQIASIAQRLDALSSWMVEQVAAAQLRDAPVLTSAHQSSFCTRLGLRVVATFSGVDSAQPSQIEQAVESGEATDVRQIVANRPEGRQLADALGERLGARVVVFENFPRSDSAGAFEEMVRGNIQALTETHQP